MVNAKRSCLVVELYSTFITKIIELHRHAFSVSLSNAKPDGTEHTRQVRYIECALHSFINDVVVNHVLQCPQAGHISLCFFNRRVKFFQLLSDSCLLSGNRDVVWSKAVHQLMTKDMCEERIEGQ